MTTIQIESKYVAELRDRAIAHGRPPDRVTLWLDSDPTMGELAWDVDLTPAELARAQSLVRWLRSGMDVTFAAWESLRADLDGLRTYHGLASPTAAQTALATKAIIRVMRALLRD